jgi:hypothetical protein
MSSHLRSISYFADLGGKGGRSTGSGTFSIRWGFLSYWRVYQNSFVEYTLFDKAQGNKMLSIYEVEAPP